MKDYLILLSGSPRGGLPTWKSLVKYVKKPLDADLALLYGDIFEIPEFLLEHTKFNWKFEEPKNWRHFYEDNFKSSNALDFLLRGQELGMAGGIDNHTGSGAIVTGFKIIAYNNYLNEILDYKYVIHSRFDQFYTDYHPKLEGDNIWIPEGEDYFGICDRHAIVPNKYIDKYFSISEFLDNKEANNEMNNKEIAPESIFLEHLKFQNLGSSIERIKRFQFTSATVSDSTRWRKAIYRLHFSRKIMIKYPDEFLVAIKNSLEKNKLLYIFKHPIFSLNFFYLELRKILGRILSRKKWNL